MNNSYWIIGKHAVHAAILNPDREIIKVISLKKDYFLDGNLIQYEIVSFKNFQKISNEKDVAHQGIAVLVKPLKKLNFLENIKNDQKIKNIIVLDEITDTRNIGSIIRTAVAFNIQAIIVNDKDFKESSQAMHKAASGCIEKIKIFKVSNLSNAVDQLKKNNFWILGLDLKAKNFIEDFQWFEKNALIFGSENKGIKKILLSKCDKLLKININKEIESLNVSNAVSATLSIMNSKLR